MKSKNSLVLILIIICLQLFACKKDKAEAPAPDPIAVYNFDNYSAKNSMSSLLHGTIKGTVLSTSDSFSIPQSAFLFSGDNYVTVADSDFLDFVGNQLTIATWIKPSVSELPSVVKKGDVVN